MIIELGYLGINCNKTRFMFAIWNIGCVYVPIYKGVPFDMFWLPWNKVETHETKSG